MTFLGRYTGQAGRQVEPRRSHRGVRLFAATTRGQACMRVGPYRGRHRPALRNKVSQLSSSQCVGQRRVYTKRQLIAGTRMKTIWKAEELRGETSIPPCIQPFQSPVEFYNTSANGGSTSRHASRGSTPCFLSYVPAPYYVHTRQRPDRTTGFRGVQQGDRNKRGSCSRLTLLARRRTCACYCRRNIPVEVVIGIAPNATQS